MSTESPPLTNPELRKLLAQEYPEFDDFIAFLRACYPTVYRQISSQMERTAITNLLLVRWGAPSPELAATIARHRKESAKLA